MGKIRCRWQRIFRSEWVFPSCQMVHDEIYDWIGWNNNDSMELSNWIENQSYNTDKEYSETPTYTTGDGFVKYAIQAYPGACFVLEDVDYDYVFSNRDWLCTDRGWEYVVHATDGDFAVDLLDYEVEIQDGWISGRLRYDVVGSPPTGYYYLDVIDQNGGHWFCDWVDPGTGIGSIFKCEDVPAPVQLRLYLSEGESVFYETNVALMLEPVDLPDLVTIDDANSDLGRVEPVVQFFGSEDEAESLQGEGQIRPPLYRRADVCISPETGRDGSCLF